MMPLVGIRPQRAVLDAAGRSRQGTHHDSHARQDVVESFGVKRMLDFAELLPRQDIACTDRCFA